MRRSTLTGAATLAALVLTLTACAPGGGSATSSEAGSATASSAALSTDVAAAGDITLTVWDQNTDPGINDAQEALNTAFQEKYPNVKIERVSRSFADLKTTLGLALDAPDAPDVVQANQGYPDMGTFVEAGLLRPIGDYATLYGWDTAFPAQQLSLNSFSADGKTWQGDNLYGVSQTGEVVGVYYNKAKLAELGITKPVTIEDFGAALQTASAAGTLPLEFGNTEKSPGIHLFGIVQAATLGATGVNELVSGKSGAWTDAGTVEAADLLTQWTTAGYLPTGSSGISRDAARDNFAGGGSLFYVDGTWRLSQLGEAMGDNVGFLALAPAGSTDPVTTGGVGLAWAITGKTTKTDAAAAYIDFITNPAAAAVLLENGNLPAVVPADYTPAAGSLESDVISTWNTVNETNGLVPYLDYATPTFYDTITAAVQELVAGQYTPQQFADTLQADAAKFAESR
ncbi:extracellular solute-binding protein [Nakamurella flavida]|uniref:Extracellular solute-binding protein n=1 Tax=Nakamurella flavida TaxID=363630 RepID=A0A939C7E4_9ACTN|nr:extracellular solute-binding protein [Nakamurella flavida]MBM9478082.1 extracellular solute-binding protein [Nakamurella flavida]MDP9778697.1 raffinose/stachyose/melibiose transport system substrate-binding protein [Nakamurella flavida]